MVRLVSAAALLGAISIPFAVGPPSSVHHVAICPQGLAPNPRGYGCVPDTPVVGAPSQEVLTRCHANYYICVWPYPVP
jgi:hypothetical protein